MKEEGEVSVITLLQHLVFEVNDFSSFMRKKFLWDVITLLNYTIIILVTNAAYSGTIYVFISSMFL